MPSLGVRRVDDLFAEWDRNKDGTVSKLEFRINVRKLGLSEELANTQQIDTIFKWLDMDNGGSLDRVEIRAGIRKLEEDYKSLRVQNAAVHERAARLRELANHVKQAAEATELYEQEQQRREAMSALPAGLRLGALLQARNVKPADIVSTWDKDGNGTIDPDEFRVQVRTLGFKASDEEVRSIFADMDVDSSGDLEVKEIMTAMKRLAAQARAAKAAEDNQVRALARAKKKAASAQEAALSLVAEVEAASQAEADEARRREAAAEAEKAEAEPQARGRSKELRGAQSLRMW